MNNPTIAPFGAWESSITAEAIVRDSVRLGQIAVDGRDVYWSELRPSENGRSTIVKQDEAGFIEVLPAEFNARTRAHEYGGGAFCVSDGDIFFCNDADQRIYRVQIGETPVPLTPEGAYRYADLVVDREHDRLICVREDHTADSEPENTLVAVRIRRQHRSSGGRPRFLCGAESIQRRAAHCLDTMAASEHAVGRDGTRYREGRRERYGHRIRARGRW